MIIDILNYVIIQLNWFQIIYEKYFVQEEIFPHSLLFDLMKDLYLVLAR